MNAILDGKPTTADRWNECESILLRKFESCKNEVFRLDGDATKIVIEISVHGVNPGRPIAGVIAK